MSNVTVANDKFDLSKLSREEIVKCTETTEMVISQSILKAQRLGANQARRAGDKWGVQERVSAAGMGDAMLKEQCQLVSVEDTPAGPVALINFIGTIQSDTPGQIGDNVVVKRATMRLRGQVRVDVRRGILQRMNTEMDCEADMSLSGQDQDAAPADARGTINLRETLKIQPISQPATQPATADSPQPAQTEQ